MLSGPEINWTCTNRSVSCKVENGSDPRLELFLNKSTVQQGHQRLITYKWNTKWNKTFKCVAHNHVDKKVSMATVMCPGAWWALIRRHKFTSQFSLYGRTGKGCSRAWVPGLGGRLRSG